MDEEARSFHLSARTRALDFSGIRKAFERGAKLKDPINLSIGQPDFPVPSELKQAAITAIGSDRNGYSLTQGDAAALAAASAARCRSSSSTSIPSIPLLQWQTANPATTAASSAEARIASLVVQDYINTVINIAGCDVR